ncbi:hypothetical protein FHEFKHOI_00579 [Candidatus Methanoperedenaceae archaeon GB50]|nr:hypothetical protein FHEFKHOI_00579 [Candidatus Methanoperedenaceae archaeon GB50]
MITYALHPIYLFGTSTFAELPKGCGFFLENNFDFFFQDKIIFLHFNLSHIFSISIEILKYFLVKI